MLPYQGDKGFNILNNIFNILMKRCVRKILPEHTLHEKFPYSELFPHVGKC